MGLLWTNIKNESPSKVFHTHETKETLAPTVESIRLANEYEHLICTQISQKLMVQTNLFNYTIAFDSYHIIPKFFIKIKINDKEYSDYFPMKPTLDQTVQDIHNWLFSHFISEITQNICMPFYVKGACGYIRVYENGKEIHEKI